MIIADKKTWDEVCELLVNTRSVLIVTHVNPDADAIGSIIGLWLMLIEKGKTICLMVDNGIPERLSFLQENITIHPSPNYNFIPDLVIALDGDDLSSLGNCGNYAFSLDVPKLVIDHHTYNEFYGNLNLVEETYVSTTMILYKLFEILDWKITPHVANALLAGIISDTQLFRVGLISERLFGIIQMLLRMGADYKYVTKSLFSTINTGWIKFLGYITFKAFLIDSVYWSIVTIEDFNRFQIDPTSEIVDELLKDQGAHISVCAIETETNKFKVSLRAMEGYDVGKIANSLGGGGHKLSAGFRFTSTSSKDIIEKIAPLLKKEIQG